MYLKPATAAKYRSTLRLYILPALGDRRLEAVSALALWYKAKAPRELDDLATQLLASDTLTLEARGSCRDH